MKKFFRTLIFLFFSLVLTSAVTACGLNDVTRIVNNPTISFDKAQVELEVGDTYTLNPSISLSTSSW